MELLPDKQTLLISQTGNMEGTLPGNLVTYDTDTGFHQLLYPLPARPPLHKPVLDRAYQQNPFYSRPASQEWGSGDCEQNTQGFSPHGISLKQRRDDRWQLAVVNHFQRESIEMFEVFAYPQGYSLVWRGCVIPPEGTYINDVALMKDGSFIASHMFERHSPLIFGLRSGMWKAQLGLDTGYVWEWRPQTPDQFRILQESRGPFINGVEISADEKYVFANVYGGNEIRKLDRVSGKAVGHLDIGPVDNSAWDNQGKLLAAAHTGSKLDQKDCMNHPGATCGFGFSIIRIDPDTLAAETIFQHEGSPMGAATVARQVGDFLYLGSFSGDRIIKIKYPVE
jgi:hypothetical protein